MSSSPLNHSVGHLIEKKVAEVLNKYEVMSRAYSKTLAEFLEIFIESWHIKKNSLN